MSYTKTNWVNDQAPAINATNLNKIEQGIFNNDALLSSIMNTLGIDTQTWVSTDSYVEGQVVVYNNQLYKNITGNYTTTPPNEDTTNWSLTNMKDMQYPVGKVEIFYDTLDHSNYMGFTWERTAVGKTITGYDSTDTDFDTIGETGGTKTHKLTVDEMPSHFHNGNYITGIPLTVNGAGSGGFYSCTLDSYNVNGSTLYTASAGGDNAHSIMQPYQVFAIWKRVS